MLLAPGPLHTTLATVDPATKVLALDGRAKDIDRLPELDDLRYLWVSRAPPLAANAIGRARTLSRLVIHDYRAADIAPLSSLRQLETLVITGSSRLRSLGGLEQLRQLEELILCDNCGYRDLQPIQSLTCLKTLCLEGGFSKPLRVDNLAALPGLTKLVQLRLASIRVGDRSLRPLHSLTSLRSVFIAATFPKPELRALANALPEAKGRWLDDYRTVV